MHRYQRELGADGRPRFVYQYVDPITGKRCRFRGTSPAECDQKRAEVEEARRRLHNGESVQAVAGFFRRVDGITLADAWKEYLATRTARARGKAEQYWRTTIDTPTGEGRTLGEYRLGELSERVIARWTTLLYSTGGRRGRGRAPSTVRLALDYIGAAVRRVGAQPAWSGFRPIRSHQATTRPWVRSLEELERLLAAAHVEDERRWSRGRYSCRWYLAAFTALTGLRNAELAGLGWDCVELDHGPPRIVVKYQAPKRWWKDCGDRPTIPPKGGVVLRQQLHETAAYVLARQREQLQRFGWYRHDGPVWPVPGGSDWARSGRALDAAAVRRWATDAELAHADEWCTHSLRHSFASFEVAGSGGDLAAAARRTGHRDLRTLLVYVHELGTGLGASPVAPLNLGAIGAEHERPRLPPAEGVTTTGVERDVNTNMSLAPDAVSLEGKDDEPPAPPDLTPTWDAVASSALRLRKQERRRRVEESRRPFRELAAEWIARPKLARGLNGQELERPQAVTDAARRNASAAYSRVKRNAEAKGEAEESWKPRASRAWQNAKRATLAAWARAVQEARAAAKKT